MSKRNWSPEIVEIGDRIAVLSIAAAAQLSAYLEQVRGIRPARPEVRAPEDRPVAVRQSPEPTAFDVVLQGYDAVRRVDLIRAVRETTGLALKAARDLVDAAPRTVGEGLPAVEAEKLKAALEAAGATVTVRGRSD